MEAWRAVWAVPLFNLMVRVRRRVCGVCGDVCVSVGGCCEAEISRALAWQWLHHGVRLSDGQTVTAALVRRVVDEELQKWRQRVGEERYGPRLSVCHSPLSRFRCLYFVSFSHGHSDS